ncbi:MAG: response regulator [Gorillibacterium sp.]|nr:response regulator [Gorillibacterium sp.]
MDTPFYSMVVIDDIRAVVNGISKDMDWSQHGIQIVGTAYNGEDGMALIRETTPDIIVTDIRMPKFSGTEMISEVFTLIPHSKIIFISGYSDFEDAQKAIRMGAFDYILKPFTPKQLVEIVLKAKGVLETEKHEHNQAKDMQKMLRESMPLLRQEYLNLLLRFTAKQERLLERWEFLQIDVEQSPLAVLVLEVDHFAQSATNTSVGEIELLRFSVQNITEETILTKTKGIVFRDSISRFVAIMNPTDDVDMVTLTDQCRENIAKYTKCTVSAGVSLIVSSLMELPDAYRQAMEALSFTYYAEGNSVLSYSNIQSKPKTELLRLSVEKEKELHFAIRTGNFEKVQHVLELIFEEWDSQTVLPSPNMIRTRYLELSVLIHKGVPELVDGADPASLEEIMRIMTSHDSSLRDMRQALEDLCRLCCDCMESYLHSDGQIVINNVISYIRDHLHVNLMVGDYARQVHLSASYFANLFKKITGMSVMQFITQERMEKAKLLLLEDKPIAEIALLLGYEERSYFSDVFKKNTGLTPTEFRNRREM